MVLGLLLYELFDIVYHVGRATYNGVHGVYCWYYDVTGTVTDEGERERLRCIARRVLALEDALRDKEPRDDL
jgi:hypothetical protein